MINICSSSNATCFLRRCSVSVEGWWTWGLWGVPDLLWVGEGMSGRRGSRTICYRPLSSPASFFCSGWQKDCWGLCWSGLQVQKYSHRFLTEKSKVKLRCALLLYWGTFRHGSHRERTQRRWVCRQFFGQSWWLQAVPQKAENPQFCPDSPGYIQSLLIKHQQK